MGRKAPLEGQSGTSRAGLNSVPKIHAHQELVNMTLFEKQGLYRYNSVKPSVGLIQYG